MERSSTSIVILMSFGKYIKLWISHLPFIFQPITLPQFWTSSLPSKSIPFTWIHHDFTMTTTMADIASPSCWFCQFNNLSWMETCEGCNRITLPTQTENLTCLEWKVHSFGGIRAPDSERKDSTSFRGCLQYLIGHPSTAIRVGDRFLLAFYPNSEKRYSIKSEGWEIRTFTLDEGGEQALLFQIVEQILYDCMISSLW